MSKFAEIKVKEQYSAIVPTGLKITLDASLLH